MVSAVEEYSKLESGLAGHPGLSSGQMFGKACLKVNGKAFIAQHKDVVVFKLTGAEHAAALQQPDAALWDPSGKGRPMKEWVALAAASRKEFKKLANAAMNYVSGQA